MASKLASRPFSTTAKLMRKLTWTLNGTTTDVTWVTEQTEESVDHVPGLEGVVSARVNGNPHCTPKTGDVWHGSVELYNSTGTRVTSAHVYPNGYIKFSKKKYQGVKLSPHPRAPVIAPESPMTTNANTKQSSSKPTKK
ncbi:hypothetical protein MGYG_03915 [Nannizzia gypsea CBS 118893]|uniref:Uncharacterized protein n=1 Tax=Arthroderma gypseum (strain ATCC MYA-4604 / CBS 118893) TaxID=535722 RepID=E4UUE5_ARTGP|nr:hypothetical protein MGYG_03915 [Nannizzia gypsea CBS 118893]EFR00912.1 hypothetical protein MGYG_03915 [Nannizzia gypsea CBS 118893]